MPIHPSPSQVPRPRIEHFWAAALKGIMTYAFTHGEFSSLLSIHLYVRTSPPPGLSSIEGAYARPKRTDLGPEKPDPGPARPYPGPGKPYLGPGKA